MREILFRGKRLDNGKWVEANSIIHTRKGATGKVEYWLGAGNQILSKHDRNGNAESIMSVDGSICYGVDPATVGQYTGLKDKNGKRIFEGDIFEWGYAGVKEFQYVVAYDAELASFVGERHFGFVSLNGIDIEIIGNIHDNPELLGGGEDG